MKQFDEDCDGRLSYKEFKHAILPPKPEEEEQEWVVLIQDEYAS